MEEEVREALGSGVFKATGGGGGGCISTGKSYLTDTGRVFVKVNSKANAERMFEGEKAGLEAILCTGRVRCPRPLKVVVCRRSPEVALVMEDLKMERLKRGQEGKLGEQLAAMHLHNKRCLERGEREGGRVGGSGDEGGRSEGVGEFGFDVPTSCGYLSQDNRWEKDWTTFYVRQKLDAQVGLLLSEKGHRTLKDLWPLCMRRIEEKLKKVGQVIPALLHGDLWSGNVAAADGAPVIFDPAAFYGHSEYDFGIVNMFGGFSSEFFDAYHKVIPKAEGFSERQDIYELFHHLNHWNHFGSGYRGSTLSLMRKIVQT